jgi:prevent-host-death family protein
MVYMKIIPVSEARGRFKATLNDVKKGERILLVRASRPIAAIVSMDDYNLLSTAVPEKMPKVRG